MTDGSSRYKPTLRPTLIWCMLCGGDSVRAAVNDRMMGFVCLESHGHHAWVEPRNTTCAACGARLMQHVPVNEDGHTEFYCPIAAHSGTFASSY